MFHDLSVRTFHVKRTKRI